MTETSQEPQTQPGNESTGSAPELLFFEDEDLDFAISVAVDQLNRQEELGVRLAQMDTPPTDADNVLLQVAEEALHRKNYDTLRQFLLSYWRYAKDISKSNGSVLYRNPGLRVGIITDTYMYDYYRDAFQLIYLDPYNYRSIIDTQNLDLVWYVSCYRGIRSQHPTEADYVRERGVERAIQALSYAKRRDIPTVFQTIEDPPDFEWFLPIAKTCDVILTSDVNMVPLYEASGCSSLIGVSEYGINPCYHNPIGFLNNGAKRHEGDKNDVFFAGSWYNFYEERCRNTSLLFDGVIEAGHHLYVADRYSYERYFGPTADWYIFPEKYQPFLIPRMGHSETQKAHKLFNFSLNLDSITDSPTMGAMRVFELQASGVLLLSNRSLSITRRFPGVFQIDHKEEVADILNGLSQREIVDRQLGALRLLMSRYTVYERLNHLFEFMGMSHRYGRKPVYVVDDGNIVLEEFRDSQTWKDFHGVPIQQLSGFSPSEGFLIWPTRAALENENYLLDLLTTYAYVDAECVDYVSRDDPHAFDFSSESVPCQGVLFNLERISPAKLVGTTDYLANLRFSIVSPNR